MIGDKVKGKSWNLEDADKYAKAFPVTYSKPSKEAIEPLEKGNKAKLVFSFKCDDPGIPREEQLWVEILLVENQKLLGQLEDDPKYIKDLKRGEIIEFYESQIIDTE